MRSGRTQNAFEGTLTSAHSLMRMHRFASQTETSDIALSRGLQRRVTLRTIRLGARLETLNSRQPERTTSEPPAHRLLLDAERTMPS